MFDLLSTCVYVHACVCARVVLFFNGTVYELYISRVSINPLHSRKGFPSTQQFLQRKR